MLYARGIFLLAVPMLAAALPSLQDAKEPPLVMYLEADGKKTPVEVDKPFEVDTKGGKTTFTLRMEPYRVFKDAGISFQYPRGAAFKVQGEGPMKLWTLSDNPAVVMVQHFKNQPDPALILKQIVEQILAQYGTASEVKQVETTVEFQKRTLKGTRLEVKVVHQLIHQSLFSFASGKDAVVLILQDAPEDDGKPSRAFFQFQKMMQDSFRFPK
jgi:hypothetical protein